MKYILAGTLMVVAMAGGGEALGAALGESDLAKLVENKVWRINWAACMGGANGCPAYWNFGRDGSVCARGIGAKPKEKCADEGKWRIEGKNLCWSLSWLGGGEGYKSVCVAIEKAGRGYSATRVGGIGVKFFDFVVE
jgi:hypothetical protein